MKLLFDENLPRSMVVRIADLWPGSAHVSLVGLEASDDATIRHFARLNDFAIVTTDDDFFDAAMVHGAPPKIIWLRIGNCTVQVIEDTLRSNAEAIRKFSTDPVEAVLNIS